MFVGKNYILGILGIQESLVLGILIELFCLVVGFGSIFFWKILNFQSYRNGIFRYFGKIFLLLYDVIIDYSEVEIDKSMIKI